MNFSIISIGAMACHDLWGEPAPTRTGHATTTLIRSGDKNILVDPGLPSQALVARLAERVGLEHTAITHVFLTSFQPDTIRGILAFDHATWWVSHNEREAMGVPLAQELKRAHELNNEDAVQVLETQVGVLQRCEVAPDNLADRVDLFPLPGPTPGHCGLLLADTRHTVLICGDAVPTSEHLEQGRVHPNCFNPDLARESFKEAIEIADLLVPGRDNLTPNPTRRPF
jgi:glyoxylase-like metal-dependent hydrolase (beta-lactamase superfamily II)